MAYIVAKKIWHKEFSEGELNIVWGMFLDLAGEVDWETTEYVDFFRNNTNIPYPETDKRDDTEGVKPKQMRKILDVLDDLDLIKALFKCLKEQNFRRAPFFEDGYISWKQVLNEEIMLMLEDENPKTKIGAYILEKTHPELSYYKYKEEVYEGFLAGEITVNDFSLILKEKPYPAGKTLSLKQLTMEDFWDERKKLWNKTLNIIPKHQALLLLEPKYWDKDVFLSTMDYFFGTKNFTTLEGHHQNNFLNLYKTFGRNLSLVKNIIKEKKTVDNGFSLLLEMYHKMDEKNPAFEKFINQNNVGIDAEYSIVDLAKVLVALTYFDEAQESLSKKQRIKASDINVLIEAADLAISYVRGGNEKLLKHMKYEHMNVLNKYNLSDQQKKWALALYERTAHLKTKVPLFKETIGAYTVEMIDKDDIRGLVAGNATNCCQTLSSDRRTKTINGSNCVYYGAEELNSTFFLVSKNNRIVAQSWVWMKKGQLTFDNIEVLGQEIRDSIADCYQAYANYVLKNKFVERVTVGTGHSDLSLGNFWKKIDNFETHSEAYDAANSQYEIKVK